MTFAISKSSYYDDYSIYFKIIVFFYMFFLYKCLFQTFHRPIYSFPRGTGNFSFQFNRLGTRLLCSGADPDLVVCDLPTLQHPTNGNMNEMVLVAPDFIRAGTEACCFIGIEDQMVLSGAENNQLYIWSLLGTPKRHKCTVDQPLCILTGHENNINCVRYSSEIAASITCDRDGVIKLWTSKLRVN